MTETDAAARWGLPPGFGPVRYPIADDVKEVVRDLLGPDEPVVVSIANEGDSIAIIATPRRLFSVRTGAMAGVTGFNVREFPWDGITNMVLQQAALNVKIVISFRTSDGRTVEVGRRAALGKPAADNLMPFESAAGTQAFEAIRAIWHHMRGRGLTADDDALMIE